MNELIVLENDGGSVPLAEELRPIETRPVELAAPVVEPASVVAPVVAAPVDEAAREKSGILAELTTTRKQAKELREFQSSVAPLLTELNKHQDLVIELERRRTGGAPIVTAAPVPVFDPEVVAATARDLALYRADGSGQLDTDAATRVLTQQAKSTQAAVQEAVERAIQREVTPIRQTMLGAQATEARTAILARTRAGNLSDEMVLPILDEMQKSDPRMLSQPGMDLVVMALATGFAQMGGAPVPAAAGPVVARPVPVQTESAHGRGVAPSGLSRLEQRAAEKHNIKPEAWTRMSDVMDRAAQGQSFILEK